MEDLMMKQTLKKFQDRVLNYRKSSLSAAGVLGLMPAAAVYHLIDYLGLNGGVLQGNLTVLFLGLPIFFTLWLFRTHDVQRQIDKTQGQIDKTQENTNNSSFFECARMLTTEDSLSKKVALEQLVYLKNETKFDKKRIDCLTRNINLRDKNLRNTRLTNLHFFKVILIKTDLTNANLEQVDLRNTDLRDAILERAILTGAKLKGATYNSKTNFQGTYLESREARDKAGMECVS